MTAVLTGADLLFDPVGHEYRLPDGVRIPSVTEILSAVGVSVDFEALGASSSRIADAIDLKRQLGQALHADAHAFDDEDLDWSTVDPRVEPYLLAWVAFRVNSGVRPITRDRERRVFHPIYRYAGTLDGLFVTPNGTLVLIDLKTGDPDDAGCAYQTAAYLAAYEHEHATGLAIARWAVHLQPSLAVPYRVTPYQRWDDFAKFQAFVTTYYCQAMRRAPARVSIHG